MALLSIKSKMSSNVNTPAIAQTMEKQTSFIANENFDIVNTVLSHFFVEHRKAISNMFPIIPNVELKTYVIPSAKGKRSIVMSENLHKE